MNKIILLFFLSILIKLFQQAKLMIGGPIFLQNLTLSPIDSNHQITNLSHSYEHPKIFPLSTLGFALIWKERNESGNNLSQLVIKTFSYYGFFISKTKFEFNVSINSVRLTLNHLPDVTGYFVFWGETNQSLNNSSCIEYSLFFRTNLSSVIQLAKSQTLKFMNLFEIIQIQNNNNYVLLYKERDCGQNTTKIKGILFQNLGEINELIEIPLKNDFSKSYADILFLEGYGLKNMKVILLVLVVQNTENYYQLLYNFLRLNGDIIGGDILQNFTGIQSNPIIQITKNPEGNFFLLYLYNGTYYGRIINIYNLTDYSFGKISLLNVENITGISASFLTKNTFIIIFNNKSLDNESFYMLYDIRRKNFSTPSSQGTFFNPKGNISNIIYMEESKKWLLLFFNETHIWGQNMRYSIISHCNSTNNFTLNCDKCKTHYEKDMFGNCQNCSKKYQLTRNKRLCVRKIPKCRIYSDENGDCEECAKGYELYLFQTRNRSLQCSLMINLPMKRMAPVQTRSYLDPIFKCFLPGASWYFLAWIEFPDDGFDFFFNHRYVKTKGEGFFAYSSVESMYFARKNLRRFQEYVLAAENPGKFYKMEIFPNNYTLFSYPENGRLKLVICDCLNLSSDGEVFMESDNITIQNGANYAIHLFNNRQFLVVSQLLNNLKGNMFYLTSSFGIDQVMQIEFGGFARNNEICNENLEISIIHRYFFDFSVLWMCNYAIYQLKYIFHNGYWILDFNEIIQSRIKFTTFSAGYLFDGRFIIVYGNKSTKYSDLLYYNISGDLNTHVIRVNSGYNPKIATNTEKSEFVIFNTRPDRIKGILFTPIDIKNCSRYDDTLRICQECVPNYRMVPANENDYLCFQVIENCATYNATSPDKCLLCEDSYLKSDDEQRCDYQSEKESWWITKNIIMISMLIALLACILIYASYRIYNYKKRKMLENRADFKIYKINNPSLEEKTYEREDRKVTHRSVDYENSRNKMRTMLNNLRDDLNAKLFDIISDENLLCHNQLIKINSLGKGGFGQVWKVRNKQEQRFALKIFIDSGGCPNKQDFENFENMAKEFENLRHFSDSPFIVKVFGIAYSFKTDEIRMGILEEFMEMSLEKFLRENGEKLDLLDRLKIAISITNGVSEIHGKDFIHHDLKPENILITQKGDDYEIKITDFGTTLHKDEEIEKLVGISAHYGAPEIFLFICFEIPFENSPKCDVWSLGVVFYKIFILKTNLVFPWVKYFQEDHVSRKYRVEIKEEILKAKKTDNNYIESISKDIPYEIIGLLNECLQVDPIKRPIVEQVAENLIHLKRKLNRFKGSFEK